MSVAAELAASMKITLDELLGPQLDHLSKMPLAPKYFADEDLVSKERLKELLIRRKRIYYFLCSILVLNHLSYVLSTL